MSEKHLLITIAGGPRTGKSSVAAELADLFRRFGVHYHLVDPNIDPLIVPHATRSIEDVMKAMADKGIRVVIQTQQLSREASERSTA